jgi:hypothetical protein
MLKYAKHKIIHVDGLHSRCLPCGKHIRHISSLLSSALTSTIYLNRLNIDGMWNRFLHIHVPILVDYTYAKKQKMSPLSI